jgi:hypothetical protein
MLRWTKRCILASNFRADQRARRSDLAELAKPKLDKSKQATSWRVNVIPAVITWLHWLPLTRSDSPISIISHAKRQSSVTTSCRISNFNTTTRRKVHGPPTMLRAPDSDGPDLDDASTLDDFEDMQSVRRFTMYIA